MHSNSISPHDYKQPPQLVAYAPGRWLTDSLPLLEGIGPLLPGAADKRPTVGNEWEQQAGWSIARLQAAKPECICWHVGADANHVGVDVDGIAPATFCQSHGCDPYTADTWRIIRTGNTERVKLVFTVTPEQRAALVAGKKTVKFGGKELAVFSKPGHQIVVLGNHYTKESHFTENDDQYAWDGRAPSDAQPMPPEWFALLTGVFCGEQPLKPATRRTISPKNTHKSNSSEWESSSQARPCPICGRDHSKACAIHRDGDSVWCYHGENNYPPDCAKSGEIITGTDGRSWAYVRDEDHDPIGNRSLFVIDKPRERSAAPDWAQGFKDESTQEAASSPSSAASDPADPSRAEVQRRTYSELVEATLAAAEGNDVDTYAELVAELMIRFRKPASAIQAALMRLLTERHAAGATTPKPGYTDITDVEHLDDLVPGFVAANEQTLLHAPKGTGKTLAALLIAKSVVLGQGMLDRSEAPQQGRVLYLATDSGCESMFTQMQELGLLELPEFRPGPQQRFFIRGHHARQGTSAWEATIPEILWLLREIQQQRFDLVIIDSAKACMELTEPEYTDNKAVGAMLTLFQRVVCPHAAVLWLHHDGRENGHNAGAKVWAERPVMVHRLERVEPPKKGQQGGSGEDDNGPPPANPPRRWECIKSRVPGGERQFIYCLQPSGEFEVAPDVEIVGNCREAVLTVMRQAAAKGEDSLRYAELVQRVECSSGRSLQTIKNTISRMKRGKEADLRPLSRGRYALSARARALGGVNVFSTKSDQNPVVERVLVGTDQGTGGTESVLSIGTGGTGSVPASVPSKSEPGTGESAKGVPIHTHPPRARDQLAPPAQVTIHLPEPAPAPVAPPRFAVGELVEPGPDAGCMKGIYEVIELDGDRVVLSGPQGPGHAGLVIVPAAACEVVF